MVELTMAERSEDMVILSEAKDLLQGYA